jgi:ribulose-5-phosphate 4-epimerase/fuculose-1-phosphate aldolase
MSPPRDPDQERLRRKQRLAAALRTFAEYGFDEGAAGHMTARDPILTDHFWANPFGIHFRQMKTSDLLLVDHQGTVVQGDGKINPAAFAIHSQVHAARPDVVAAAHTHSVYGRAFAALGRRLDPITQDACAFYQDHQVFDDYTGVVLDPEGGKRIAQALGGCKGVILRNHGLLTVGRSVEEAAWWFIALDRCCQVQLLAEAAGKPRLIDPVNAALTRDTIGTEQIGRFSFRPLYDDIVARQPDLLD